MSLIRRIKTGWNAILIHMKIAFFLFGQFIRFENFVCFYTKNCNTSHDNATYVPELNLNFLTSSCWLLQWRRHFQFFLFFPISFSFPNSIYNLLENNIYKFWFVIVVFFGSRRARARRSSDAFSFLIGRKRSKICCHVSWCELGIAWCLVQCCQLWRVGGKVAVWDICVAGKIFGGG